MEVVLVPLFFAAFIGLIFWLNWKHQKKVGAILQALADRHGLLYIAARATFGGFGTVEGTVAGRTVRFWSYTTGSGKHKVTWCAVGLRPQASSAFRFTIRRQGLSAKIMEWFGKKDVEVGDPAFDQAWYIKSDQPEFLSAALVPEIREKLSALPATTGESGYTLENGEVRYAVQLNYASDKCFAALEERLPILRDLADVADVFAASGGR